MMRRLALVWLAVVVIAGGYVLSRVQNGLPLRTDLLALLPREDRDPVLQLANETVTRNLSRRVIMLVGHSERASAREAAIKLKADLTMAGALAPEADAFSAERFKRIGQLYFPYRHGLLAEDDRLALQQGRGAELADRALAQAFSVGGIADARLLQTDPFLLMPAFLTNLPLPLSRLAPDDGLLTVVDNGTTWIAVLGILAGEPFALEAQERLVAAFNSSTAALHNQFPSVAFKRLGAVFFAHQGSQRGLTEASTLSTLSIVGSIALIVLVFRRVMPLIGNLLVVAVGIGMGLAMSLFLFGDLHVAALLFGTSLIGMAVDYGLFYTASVFDPSGRSADERLKLTLPGMTLGLITSILGYGALLLAPFPGLRQIAVFSVIGLIAAFLTVVLWLPLLDRRAPLRQSHRLVAAADRVARFWQEPRAQRSRLGLLVLAAAITLLGLAKFRTDDDVRRLQSLAPELLREQEEIRGLIGATAATQFLLIEGRDDEAALRAGENLLLQLTILIKDGALASAQLPAAFVPSAARQRENRELQRDALYNRQLDRVRGTLGLPADALVQPGADPAVMSLDAAVASDAVPFLRELVLAPGLHVVALQGLRRADDVRSAVAGLPGVRFVDPTADFSALLGRYRNRAVLLTLLSVLAMFAVLTLRYGPVGAAWVMLPAGVTAILTPALLAVFGQPYSFFHAMAQVILLAVATDYALFCAEAPEGRSASTLFSVWLAAFASLLSFGLLAFSSAPAVRDFGETMLVGIMLSVALAPLANRACGRQKVAGMAARN